MSVVEDNEELADGLIAMITPTWIMYGGSSGLLAGELASINCSPRLAYQTVALTGVEVGYGGLFGAAATTPRSSAID